MADHLTEPLNAYQSLGLPTKVTPIEMGLINKTYLVTTDKLKFIFQELSPIFQGEVNFDSDAINQHLAKKHIISPKIYKTDSGELFFHSKAGHFRALHFIEGKSFNTCTLGMAHSAGLVVGQFHQALLDLDYNYRSFRKSAGDYTFHQENLIKALQKHPDHDFFPLVSPLAEKMLKNMSEIHIPPSISRHIHGDPKISNIIFEGEQAICLVDFDTLQKASWALELADAFRSWCNPYKEDDQNAFADLSIAEKALTGYATVMKDHFSLQEAENLSLHCQAISLCLGLRYLADTLWENYFNFDAKRFSRRSEHNWLRAQAMYRLYLDFSRQNRELLVMIKDILL